MENQYINTFQSILTPEQLEVGDTIACKLLSLCPDTHQPVVSNFEYVCHKYLILRFIISNQL